MKYSYKIHKYRGLDIYENERGEKFDTPYFTVVNKLGNKEHHCHANTFNAAKKIIDCFHKIKKGMPIRGSLTSRNKACRLLNTYVEMKY